MDLPHARCQLQRAFRNNFIIALSKIWLEESVPDVEVSLDNFLIIRSNRMGQLRKMWGRMVCLYVNINRRCKNIKVHRKVCTPNPEMLTLSLRPYYLPWEFPMLVVSCVYIPPSANIKTAAELVAEDANAMMAKYPGALAVIMGDFNTCRLDNVLPTFQQYVDIPTRKANILYMRYGNITDA